MQIRRHFCSFVLLGLIPLLGGCALFLVGAGIAAGVGVVTYMNGELRVSEETTVLTAYAATIRTMNDLQFKVSEQQKDALAGKVIAKRADGTSVSVILRQQSEKVVEIRIRVGTFGDESLSKLMYEKIKKNL